MTKARNLLVSFCVVLAAFSSSAMAFDNEDLIEARQGLMNLYAVNLDLLGEMIRGNIPYDQKRAQSLADNLFALASMNSSALWRRGTSLADDGMRGKTAAKPELWQNRGDVSQRYIELTTALEVLAKNAGWSVDALEENIGDVNISCKSCHREYRAKR